MWSVEEKVSIPTIEFLAMDGWMDGCTEAETKMLTGTRNHFHCLSDCPSKSPSFRTSLDGWQIGLPGSLLLFSFT